MIFITLGSDPPPPRSDNHFFWQIDHFLSTFGKKCIFPFENPKTLQKISKNWCCTCKMAGTSLKMLAIPQKMMAAPCKISAAPCVMLATTHLMFAKDQRGLEVPPSQNLVTIFFLFLEIYQKRLKFFMFFLKFILG